MAKDLLDPTTQDDTSDNINPERNAGQQDYDDKFNTITGTPENQAFGDQANASAQDGFKYSPDPDRQDLAEQEGGGSNLQPTDDKESSLYKPEESKPKAGLRSRLAGGRLNSISKTKKRALLAVGGLFGAGGVVALLFLMFMIISGFNVKHAAEVMDIANMSRLHIASYRRTSQYLVEESLNPAGSSQYRVNRQGKTLFDRLQRFDPNSALGNLRQTEQLSFITEDNTKRSWSRLGRSVTTTDLKYLQVGKDWVPVPERSRLNPIQSYREQKAFIEGIEQALDEHQVLKGKSRIYRTKTVNAIIAASDIKLYRWVDRGRGIKTFKDSILSAYERMTPRNTRSSNLPDVNEAAEDYKTALEEGPDNPTSAADLHDRALRESLEGRGSTLRNFARGATVAGLTATLYCAGRDYMAAREDNAKDMVVQYKQSSALLQSTSSQIESGDVTMNAVMMEAKRWDGFNQSQRYQQTIGNPEARFTTPDLDPSEAPIKTEGGALYTFYNGVITGAETALLSLRLVPSSEKDRACRAITGTAGQVGTAIVENVAGAVASVFTAGAASAGQQAARAALQQGFRQAARAAVSKEVRGEIAGNFVRRSAGDIFTFVLIDQALKMVMNEGGNTAVDDASKTYAKSDVGYKLISNDIANSWRGRPLNAAEVSELDNMVKERRIASLKKQPLLKRLTNLNDPQSPVSQMAINLPYSPESLQSKGTSFARTSMNPLASFTNNSSKLARAGLGSDTVMAYREINDSQTLGIPTVGYSAAELDKMVDDPSFWPQENAKIVEDALEADPDAFSRYKDCFPQMEETALTECTREELSSDEALRYRLYSGLDGGLWDENSGSADYNDGLLGSLLNVQEITSSNDSVATQDQTPVGSIPTGPVSGSDVRNVVGCGGNIRVHHSILQNTEDLCAAAEAAGHQLRASSSWRNPADQIRLRTQNCGSSHYAIYQMPSSACSPPTARPGSSNHERGLAIDFSDMCFRRGVVPTCPGNARWQWLTANASRFGFSQLASEAWHWEVK